MTTAGDSIMTEHARQILQKALLLSPDERIALIEELVTSLDSESRRGIENLWVKEAEDRIDAYQRGAIKAIPAEEVFGEAHDERP
jgi:putative addiction module component (TIGR02574 family)